MVYVSRETAIYRKVTFVERRNYNVSRETMKINDKKQNRQA